MSASEPYRTLPRAKKLSIIKLSQARELLASGLGHNTYASLRKADLATLELARYVILDIERRLRRAADLLLPLTLDQWWTVHRELASGYRQ